MDVLSAEPVPDSLGQGCVRRKLGSRPPRAADMHEGHAAEREDLLGVFEIQVPELSCRVSGGAVRASEAESQGKDAAGRGPDDEVEQLADPLARLAFQGH